MAWQPAVGNVIWCRGIIRDRLYFWSVSHLTSLIHCGLEEILALRWIEQKADAGECAAQGIEGSGWKPCFSKRLYRERKLIERFFSKLEHFRRVATRDDKLAANFLAMVQLASIRLWLRTYESTA